MKINKKRRDFFCELLKEKLTDFFSFEIPKGGMAVWVKLNKKYSWKEVSAEAKKFKLSIDFWELYDFAKTNHNAIRIGFATYTEDEIKELILRLENTMKALRKIK